jgi:hypothetical protein
MLARKYDEAQAKLQCVRQERDALALTAGNAHDNILHLEGRLRDRVRIAERAIRERDKALRERDELRARVADALNGGAK